MPRSSSARSGGGGNVARSAASFASTRSMYACFSGFRRCRELRGLCSGLWGWASRSMGASKGQIFRMVKLPSSLGRFFSSLRVSVSYSIVGAVIAEWLGGNSGLGVYMTRVRKSYAFDKMFAVIVLISLISLLLMWLVSMIQRLCMPYEKYGGNQS